MTGNPLWDFIAFDQLFNQGGSSSGGNNDNVKPQQLGFGHYCHYLCHFYNLQSHPIIIYAWKSRSS